MKKIEFSKKEIQKLLSSIKNDEDRKAVEHYLQDLMDVKSGERSRDGTQSRKANRALDFIVRVGLKLGESALVEEIVRHLFD